MAFFHPSIASFFSGCFAGVSSASFFGLDALWGQGTKIPHTNLLPKATA